MNPLTYIHDESVRQSATVTEMAGMCKAYNHLVGRGPATISEIVICDVADYITGSTYYRRVPVYFRNGGHAANWANIPRSMDNLIAWINETSHNEVVVDAQMKEFLDIHPFVDGNGRVASLLRNYLLGTLNDPTPLPYYFGEN